LKGRDALPEDVGVFTPPLIRAGVRWPCNDFGAQRADNRWLGLKVRGQPSAIDKGFRGVASNDSMIAAGPARVLATSMAGDADQCVTGVLSVATRGTAGPGEVRATVRGSREHYLAWSLQPLAKGANVLIVGVRSARTVDVEPWPTMPSAI
jgi:hypothetical protein